MIERTEEEQLAYNAQVLEGGQRPVQFPQVIGLKFDRLDRTSGEGHFLVTQELCSPYGLVHGGVLFTIMDHLSGMVACTSGIGAVTMESSVSFLRVARLGETVLCRAQMLKEGSRVAVCRAECLSEDGTLLCTGNFNMVFTKPIGDDLI